MPDSRRERIVKNRVGVLQGITTANGFANTIASVQRPEQDGQDFTAWPLVIVYEGRDPVAEQGPEPLVSRELELDLVVQTRQDTASDPRSANEVLSSLTSDVIRAMMAEPTSGGLALDTVLVDEQPFPVEEGEPELARLVSFTIRYRHLRTDPTQP